MPSSNITADFRKIIQEKEREIPDAKRRKLATKSSRIDSRRDGEVHIGKEYMSEAYIILNHINTLTRMLANIRKPYLNVDSRRTHLGRQASRNIDLNGGDPSWAGIKHLTNEERDQIDLQSRVILTRCADRVKEMEAIEKRRAELVASETNPLARLLPARLRHDASTMSSDFLAAHHSGVTWYLSRRLAEASQMQKEMQEERVKRQLERTRSLGSGAAREALHMTGKDSLSTSGQAQTKGMGSWLGDASSSLLAATIGAPSSNDCQSTPSPVSELMPPSEEEDDELELSASQILQFETENANILQSVQDALEAVQQAEARLMDISALQMELVNHLTRQTELTDQLYEDAIATTSAVEKGNIQLKEAKRRAKDSRLFILVFLIGASLSLLFLHYY
ncbi:putative SNARE-complex protein Syntaxin-18 N-terminus [Lyophyllum shimeji]|uniref:SNARE-complex protein Syntaxin-18 N-terminus n=1 Tax=Lyophyllum shimeji TaxID=47721 RepID=A0A9P3PCT4_LYOSH|nr:putative SNARE-complex protein Syntaxin-18 N-terminus [Lyophyllum shimeji]